MENECRKILIFRVVNSSINLLYFFLVCMAFDMRSIFNGCSKSSCCSPTELSIVLTLMFWNVEVSYRACLVHLLISGSRKFKSYILQIEIRQKNVMIYCWA